MNQFWNVACFGIAGTLLPDNNKTKMASNIPRAPPIDYRPSTASTLQVRLNLSEHSIPLIWLGV